MILPVFTLDDPLDAEDPTVDSLFDANSQGGTKQRILLLISHWLDWPARWVVVRAWKGHGDAGGMVQAATAMAP